MSQPVEDLETAQSQDSVSLIEISSEYEPLTSSQDSESILEGSVGNETVTSTRDSESIPEGSVGDEPLTLSQDLESINDVNSEFEILTSNKDSVVTVHFTQEQLQNATHYEMIPQLQQDIPFEEQAVEESPQAQRFHSENESAGSDQSTVKRDSLYAIPDEEMAEVERNIDLALAAQRPPDDIRYDIRSLSIDANQNLDVFHQRHEMSCEVPLNPISNTVHENMNPVKFTTPGFASEKWCPKYQQLPFVFTTAFPLTEMPVLKYVQDMVQSDPPREENDQLVMLPYYDRTRCTYNWYYNGGALACSFGTFFGKYRQAFFASTDKNHNLVFAEVTLKANNECRVNCLHSLSMKPWGPVFEIIFPEKNGPIKHVAVRQQLCITLVNVNIRGKLELTIAARFASTEPIVSFSFLKSSPEIANLCSIDIKGIIKTYEEGIESPVKIPGRDVPFDGFTKIAHLHGGNYLLADRFNVKIYDARSPEKIMVNHKVVSELCEVPCDFVSDFCWSPSDPSSFYLGTYHSVYQMDVRSSGFVNRWSHLLTSPPVSMDATSFMDKELVCLTSQLTNKKVCVGTGIAREIFMVQQIPSMSETILSLKEAGVVNFKANMDSRANHCCTGIRFLQSTKENLHVISSNALGDIYISNAVKEDDSDNLTFDRTGAVVDWSMPQHMDSEQQQQLVAGSHILMQDDMAVFDLTDEP